MIELPNVTLVAVDGMDADLALKALELSCKKINFAKIKLLCPYKPTKKIDNIEHHTIDKMDWIGYNQFMLFKLNKYIDTEFCINIQTDGFIINPNLWIKEFLEYDYIGSVWKYNSFQIKNSKWIYPEVKKKLSQMKESEMNLIGGGGFSLRSKTLLETTARCIYPCDGPEDAYIGINHYDFFDKEGIKFSPRNIANKFSKDPCPRFDETFGFHGNKLKIKTMVV